MFYIFEMLLLLETLCSGGIEVKFRTFHPLPVNEISEMYR